jgi:hypothetical protein
VRFAPAVGLIAELALPVSVGLWGAFPVRRFQLVHQARRFARRNDELHIRLFVCLHRLGTVEAGIGTGVNRLHAGRQACEHAFQMPCDLRTGGPIAIAQLTRDVFPCLGEKRQDRLEALLSPVFRVVAFASSHLVAEHGVHGGVGIDRDHLQLNVSRFPYALTQDPLDF